MKKAFIVIIVLIVLGVVVCLSFYQSEANSKTGYVKLGSVYNAFEFKKELESKLTNVQQKRKYVLDSLELELKMFSEGLNKKDEKKLEFFEIKKEEYFSKKQQFEEDNNLMSQQYNEQITKQLNQYVQEFGKENNYTYIYGAEGSGAIMYADEKNDLTERVIKYINEKYKGIAK